MSAFGDRVRELRLEAGLNQRDLAGMVGVSVPYMSKIEAGKESPSSRVIVAIAEALGANSDELLVLDQQLPPDFVEVVTTKPDAPLLLRAWHDGRVSDENIQKLLKGLR